MLEGCSGGDNNRSHGWSLGVVVGLESPLADLIEKSLMSGLTVLRGVKR